MPGFDFPSDPPPGAQYVYGNLIYEYNGYAWVRQGQNLVSPPDGVPDGDKGDIIVSGGGYIWLFDPTVVTAAGRAILDDANAAAQRVTLGLGNVDNTSDANKPINAATQTALNNKYDKTGGPISGGVSVAGGLEAKADLYVSNGRIVNYGAGGSAEQSYYFLNQTGTKSLYNDGIALNLQGTPFKVTSTGQSSFAGALSVGGLFAAAGNVTVGGTLDVAGRIDGRTIRSVNGIMWNYGYQGAVNTSVIYMSQDGAKYIHNDGVTFNFAGTQVAVYDATEATSYAAASVRLSGGLGVAKAIRSGGAIVAGSTLHSTGYTYFGSTGIHFAGPADGNTEIHAFAGATYAWYYNRSTGALVWNNGSGNALTIDNAGTVSAIRFSTGNTIYAGGSADVGPLNVRGDAYASGQVMAGANIAAYGDTTFGFQQGGGYRYQYFAPPWHWRYNQGTGDLQWIGNSEVYLTMRADASLLLAYQRAYMPGGGPWGDSSDERIKIVLDDYTLGLDEIKQLEPVRYIFRGNDTNEPPGPAPTLPGKELLPTPKAAPFPNSPHYGVAYEGTEFVGLVAQEVEAIFPGMVTQREGFIDGQPVTDLRDLNTSELIFALVNAVKTLAARVEALEAPV